MQGQARHRKEKIFRSGEKLREIVHFPKRVRILVFDSKRGFPARCGNEKTGREERKRGFWCKNKDLGEKLDTAGLLHFGKD